MCYNSTMFNYGKGKEVWGESGLVEPVEPEFGVETGNTHFDNWSVEDWKGVAEVMEETGFAGEVSERSLDEIIALQGIFQNQALSVVAAADGSRRYFDNGASEFTLNRAVRAVMMSREQG